MKKVLIIAHDFYHKEIISAIRVHGLVNYLPHFGWEPIILTSESSSEKSLYNCEIIEIPYINKKLTRYNNNCKKYGIIYRLTNRFFEEFIGETYDYNINWLNTVLNEYQSKISLKNVDVMISTSPPETSHLIAYNLKKIHNIPWVADLRDLWTQNHYYGYFWFRKKREKKLEKKILLNADALITVSEPLALKLGKIHTNKKIYSIPNGFDHKNINHQEKKLTKNFSIIYTGKLLSGIIRRYRNPEPLFKVLKELINNNLLNPELISVDFYGKIPSWVLQLVNKYELNKIVNIHGDISREDSIKKQREAQILLLLTWNHPHEQGVLTGKLYDYFAAQRPILSIGYFGGILPEILNKTQAGIHCSNSNEIKNALLNFYEEYLQKGYVTYHGINLEIYKYSHREMAKKFAKVMDKVINSSVKAYLD